MQIALDEIKIKRRIRQTPGDIETLMDSIREFGLLHPVTVNSRYVLIAGLRRYEAAKRLGWRTINAIVVENTDRIRELELELEENVQREGLTDQELAAAWARLEKLRHPNILVRIWRAIADFFKSLFRR